MLQSPRIPDSVKGILTDGDLDNQNSSLFQCTINHPLKIPFFQEKIEQRPRKSGNSIEGVVLKVMI
ncbi:hypothetical protein B5D77_14250 [Microcystis sp. MC19]|uniref:hypothetical protein n=1 Tax=Microcystis TaxID=1125 RepID=UPI000D12BCFF|nr:MULTISPECIES: hypothetical protein [Microcystis]AVQ72311.1 hypothetical protein B5D77_14250 [Microcystis sp. MC19]